MKEYSDTIPKSKILCSVLIILFFGLGGVSGWYFRKHTEIAPTTFVRENSSDYKFIRPILLLQVPEDDSSPEFQDLKKQITSSVSTDIKAHTASDVSVYFRELDTNRWVGVNADDLYSPASMLKVASMISFFRASEDDPSLLTKEITLAPKTTDENVTQDYYPPAEQAKVGNTYSTDQLLAYTIIDSDNNADAEINTLAGDKTLAKTLTDLKIPAANPTTPVDFISVKMYSRLFRALYNGTYISQALSEKALGLLSKTTFNGGLVAGVPAGTLVSHKFGERTQNITNTTNQITQTIRELHDCGIVYAPNNPYFLCIMTKGTDFPTLQKIISDISGLVWQQRDSLSQ